ncbi:MAG TPA: tetratricopeptide repeat protein, partial [Polyangiaceae bacterium]|nr:tetratricopeptide repeat protein [Polyangiaceae bacterium]
WVMRRFRVAAGTAFALSTMWGLLPRLTEATAWVAGRTDVLATSFVLAALLVYRPHRVRRVVIASALVAVGLFAKEVALAGCVALVAMEVARKRWALASIPMVVAASFLILRRAVLGPRVDLSYMLPPGDHITLAAVGEYTRMLLVPWRPELQIGLIEAPSRAMAAVGALALLGLTAFAYARRDLWLRSRQNVQPLVLLGSAIATSALAAVLHVIPLALNVVAADRFLYLPTVGLTLALAPCIEMVRMRRMAKGVIAAALSASLFVATFVRVGDWCDEVELWAKACRTAPRGDALPLNELGNVYFRAGLFERALPIYGRALPNVAASVNYGSTLDQLGRYDEAVVEVEMLCAAHPKLADNCLTAALVEMHQLRFADARAHVRIALDRTHGEYPAATQMLSTIARAESAVAAPARNPVDAFGQAITLGRRVDALHAGEIILADRQAPRAARREAAEYWARFGPPLELGRLLRAENADVVDAPMLQAIALRATTATKLEAKWATLGF